jgi:hypothetical protein
MESIRQMERHIQGYVSVNGNPECTHLKVVVSFRQGGLNMWDYKQEQKGYYLSVSPVKKEVRDGFTWETSTIFTGYKSFIQTANRFNKKQLVQLFENVADDYNKGEGAVCQIMDRVKSEQNVAIV